jgi:putative transposase
MKCECGNVIDRDRNSAVNILVRFYSQFALWMGYSQFESNLRNTGLPAPKLEVYSQEAIAFRLG